MARIVIVFATVKIMLPVILQMVPVLVLLVLPEKSVKINVIPIHLVWSVLNSVNVISIIRSLVKVPMANVFANRDGEVY